MEGTKRLGQSHTANKEEPGLHLRASDSTVLAASLRHHRTRLPETKFHLTSSTPSHKPCQVGAAARPQGPLSLP